MSNDSIPHDGTCRPRDHIPTSDETTESPHPQTNPQTRDEGPGEPHGQARGYSAARQPCGISETAQPSPQAVYCDSVLTGLALMEAFRSEDRDLLEGMIAHSDPVEALVGVLTASSVLIDVMTQHPDRARAEVAAEVRSRVMRNLANA